MTDVRLSRPFRRLLRCAYRSDCDCRPVSVCRDDVHLRVPGGHYDASLKSL